MMRSHLSGFCLFILLWGLWPGVTVSLQAQSVTRLPDQNIYRDNPYSLKIQLTPADSAMASSATLYRDPPGAQPLAEPLQPTVSRTGRTVIISWSGTQTHSLPDPRGYLEIKAGAVVRFTAYINTNKNAQIVTLPGSFTVVSPAAEVSGPILLPGSTSRTYPLQNVLYSGYTITHNRSNRLVTGVFFRDDTSQIDPLWRTEIVNDNMIIVRGPPGETFSGKLVLSFPTNLSN